MSGSRNIVLTLSTKGAEKVRADLEALGPAGEAALKRLDDAAKRSGAGMQAASTGSDSLRQKLGGLGLQLQDVAVQAQSGTAALTILGQQGPQIASLFGPAGAIAGAGIVMAAFAGQLALAALNGKQLSDVFKEIDASSKLADEAAQRRVKGLEEEATRLNALAAAYREYNAQALAGERARLTNERESLDRSTRSSLSSLDSAAFGATSLRRAIQAADYSGEGTITGPVEQEALDRLSSLNDIASITRERLLEVRGALDEAAKAGGPLASAFDNVGRALDAQMGPLTEAGEKARQNAANLRLIEEAASPAAAGVTGVGNAASGTAGQVSGLNTALDATRQRLIALAQARVANPFEDVEESLKRIQAQRAALERGGTEAFTAEQRRQTAAAQIASRVDADVARLEEALRKTNANGEEVTRRLAEARTEATRLRTEEANGQAALLNDVDARRRAEQEARKEATAGRAAARAEERAAAKERMEQIRVEQQLYETLRTTQSGLLSTGTADDRAIREIGRATKGTALDPDEVKKRADAANKIVERANAQQAREAERTFDRITDYAGNAFADLFLDTEGGWKKTMANLQRVAIATFAKIAFEAAARPIIMPIIQSVVGGAGGGAAGIAGAALSATQTPGSQPVLGSDSGLMGYAKQAGGMFDMSGLSGSNPMMPGYSFSGGMLGRVDGALQTNIGGFLDTPVFSAQAPAYGPYSAANPSQAFTGSANSLTYGQAAAGGLSIIGGAYGIYSGIQTGGAKGFAQGVSGVAGVAGGAAGIAAGSGMFAAGGAMAGAMATVAAVAPYIAVIAAVVAMLLPGQKPSNREGNYTIDTVTGEGVAGGQDGKKLSEENRAQAKALAEQMATLAKSIGKVTGLPNGVADSIRVGFGDRDGAFYQNGTERQKFTADENGARGMVEQATRDLLAEALKQTPDENVRKVLTATGTTDIEGALKNLEWYENTYKALTEAVEKTTQWAQSLKALNDPWDQAIEKARSLGLATEVLADKQADAVEKATKSRDLQLRGIGLGLEMELAQSQGGSGLDQIAELQRMQYGLQVITRRDALEEQLEQMGAAESEVSARLRTLDDINRIGSEALEKNIAAARKAPNDNFWAADRQVQGRGYLNDLMGLRASTDAAYTERSRAGVSDADMERLFAGQVNGILSGLSADQLRDVVTSLGSVDNAAATLAKSMLSTAEATQAAADSAQKAAEREDAAGSASGVVVSLADYVRSLRMGEASGLSQRAQFEAAEGSFRSTVAGAQAGDWNAITSLQASAEAYRTTSRNVNGSGAADAATVQNIANAISSVADLGSDRLRESVMVAEGRTNTQTLVTELQAMRAELAALRRETRQQGSAPPEARFA